MKTAAVLATYNRKEICANCVGHLLAQSAPLAGIFIADNGSTDGTVAHLRARFPATPSLRILEMGENLGNAGGIAAAMRQALKEEAEAVWILDDDAWPRPDALETLLSAKMEDKDVPGSFVIDPVTEEPSWPYAILENGRQRIARLRAEIPAAGTFRVRGTWLGALVPRNLVEEIGLPDARLFIRGEDEEYPARLRAAGYRFFCVVESVVEHPAAGPLDRVTLLGKNFFYEPDLPLWKAYYATRNQVYVRRLYASSWIGGIFSAVGTVVLAIVFALVSDDAKMSRVKVLLQAGFDGFRERLGKRREAL